MKPPPILETTRLRLRAPDLEDAEAVFAVSAWPRDCWCYARVKETA